MLLARVPPVQANDAMGLVFGLVLSSPVAFAVTFALMRLRVRASKTTSVVVALAVTGLACYVIAQVVPHIRA